MLHAPEEVNTETIVDVAVLVLHVDPDGGNENTHANVHAEADAVGQQVAAIVDDWIKKEARQRCQWDS